MVNDDSQMDGFLNPSIFLVLKDGWKMSCKKSDNFFSKSIVISSGNLAKDFSNCWVKRYFRNYFPVFG